jgi:NAD(P)-dependent dehydrogenase (short-subunit alcohol dehydrogenase family)
MTLDGKVAVVTGASRGVGKGIAQELMDAGAFVYITGRSVDDMRYVKARGVALECDHRDDRNTELVFRRIAEEKKRIDILVNNVWGGYENMLENGEFTWTRPFWQQPIWRWDSMFNAGVRAHYIASRFAAPIMVERQRGLIVNVSFWAAQKYVGNVAYGVSKSATDKMTSDMSAELKPHNVAVVSLYPGLVRTEKVMAAAEWLDLSNSESPRFIGKAIVGLSTDAKVMERSGQVVIAAALAKEYGFTDIDGRQPRPLTIADV